MLKRIISAVLCVMLALTAVPTYLESTGNSITAEAATDYETPYYYSQLSDDAKKVYNALKEAALECKKKVTVKANIGQEDFNMIAELLILHDPITFNVRNITADNVTRKSASFTIQYSYSKDSYQKMTAAYEKQVDKILAKLTDDMSKYKKIRVIHDEIINRAVYDLDSSSNDNIYGTLVKKKAKCDGYAKTFSYICAKAGIRTTTVIGFTDREMTGDMHMWNKVYFNKKWYNVDLTWDDPVSNMADNTKHDYFMISDDEIGRTHIEDNLSFKVPEATDSTIGYYEVNKKYAEDLDSAKDLIKKGAVSAVKNKKTVFDFQCSSKSVLEQVKKYVLDTKKMNSVLKSVKKSTGVDVIPEIYSYSFSEDLYTVKIMLFYNDTDLDYYFVGDDPISEDMIDTLAAFGIK